MPLEYTLQLSNKKRFEDRLSGIHYLSEEERCAYEVFVCHDGLLMTKAQDGRLYDTRDMVSHEKQGRASYVMTVDSRLFVFNHQRKKNNIAHSSITKGEPVLGAGEIEISNGKITLINTLSGHYQPDLLSIKQVLFQLHQKNVPIDKIKLVTFTDLEPFTDKKPFKIEPFCIDGKNGAVLHFHHSDAIDIFEPFACLQTNPTLTKVLQDLEAQEKGYLSLWFRWLEKLPFIQSGLTEKRERIHDNIKQVIYGSVLLSAEDVKTTLHKIDQLVNTNNNLSVEYGKKICSGRVHAALFVCKKELEKLQREVSAGVITEEDLEREATVLMELR